MNTWIKVTTIGACLALGACEGDMSSTTENTEANGAATTDMAENAPTVTLETKSFEEFKTSLAFMKASLAEEDRMKLTKALTKLSGEQTAAMAGADGRALTVDKTLAESVYNKLGDKLDGKTYEDVLVMAG
ncbi:hypothetical protein [Kordiimonas sp.]|uniref:hypothetical protein n=1 Tax=Kordiimonas sp. TaxID=1970157 RepID=UPI003A94550D